jgi:uncharacterized repeat protein (TIGR02543 family)
MKKLVLTALAALGITAAHASPNFPFPRNASYPYGIKATNADSSDIQNAFTAWKTAQLDSNGTATAANGGEMRVKWDTPSMTVSEGIGYGMLIMVYMDNATNNTQGQFDKMWNYYKNNENGNGLMNWEITGYSTVSGSNGATDADLDVALALMMAYKQWGNSTYLTNAQTLISAIYNKEVNSGLLSPGDGWNEGGISGWTNDYNPSYFSTAALEIFKNDQATGSDWANVLTTNFALVAKNTAQSSVGLPSNWCNTSSGAPTSGTTTVGFNYDAIRTPYRLALGYAWFGHTQAHKMDSTIANWAVNSSPISGNPASVVDGYSVSGAATGTYNIATFVGALGTAGMVDSKFQSWVNSSYSRLMSGADGTGYFNSSLKVLYGLLLSGNLNNLWASTATSATKFALTTSATNGTITLSPTGGSYDSGTVVTATETPSTGYEFTGWSGACSGTATTCSVTMNAAKTLTANFAALPVYTLTTSAGNGTITLSPTGGSYDSGAVVTATATPPSGYVLSAWTGACSGSGACSITMNANKTLGATWVVQPAATYVLTVTAGTGGKVVRSPDSASYSAGKLVTLTARADSAYTFSGWSGACSGTDTVCTVTMSAAQSVTASFTAVNYYTLAFTTQNGTVTTSPAGPEYAQGSTVVLTAVPNTGYALSAWYTNCASTSGNTCTIVIPNYNMTISLGFVVSTGISRHLLNGERLVMAQGVLNVDASGLGSTRLVITDLQGRSQVLWQGEMDGARQFSLQRMKAGVYFAHLEGQTGSYSKLLEVVP